MEAEELRQIAERAGMDPALENLHSAALIDGHGRMHLPLEAAEKLAKAFAAAEPWRVLMYIDDLERGFVAEGNDPGAVPSRSAARVAGVKSLDVV
jgi:hypothetical protein